MRYSKADLEKKLNEIYAYFNTALKSAGEMSQKKISAWVRIVSLADFKKRELEELDSTQYTSDIERLLNSHADSINKLVKDINTLEKRQVIEPLVTDTPLKRALTEPAPPPKPHPSSKNEHIQRPDYFNLAKESINKALVNFYEAIPAKTADELSSDEKEIYSAALALHNRLKEETNKFFMREINHVTLKENVERICIDAEKGPISQSTSLWKAFVGCLINIVNSIVKYTLGQIEGGPQRLFNDPETPKLAQAFHGLREDLGRLLNAPLMKKSDEASPEPPKP